MKVLRILVADDHALMRAALKNLFESTPGFELVGEAANGAQVAPLVAATQPDVVLLDLAMPQLDGLGCLERLVHRHPDVDVVVLSASADPDTVDRVFRLGAAGYVVKSINPLDLPAAVRQAVEGSFHTAPAKLIHQTESAREAAGLSTREASVLDELARGRSNREIARTLYLSEQTVKFHLRNIYRKLDVGTRAEAVRYACDHRLIRQPVA